MDEATRLAIEKIEAEDNRQNKRIENIEDDIKSIREIATSIKELTLEIKHLREDVQTQGARIEKLENAPLDTWSSIKKTTVTTIVTTLIGFIIGIIITKIGG